LLHSQHDLLAVNHPFNPHAFHSLDSPKFHACHWRICFRNNSTKLALPSLLQVVASDVSRRLGLCASTLGRFRVVDTPSSITQRLRSTLATYLPLHCHPMKSVWVCYSTLEPTLPPITDSNMPHEALAWPLSRIAARADALSASFLPAVTCISRHWFRFLAMEGRYRRYRKRSVAPPFPPAPPPYSSRYNVLSFSAHSRFVTIKTIICWNAFGEVQYDHCKALRVLVLSMRDSVVQ
jgi:hypothetical protein